MLSLPGVFGTTLDNIPADVPYLAAGREAIDAWRARLLPLAGFRVGICWQGCPTHKADAVRSIPLRCFEPLARVAGVRLISLQKREGLEQLSAARERFAIHEPGHDWDEARGAFVDSAAIMRNLDLVVTADTSIAHLAGGLGINTWVVLAVRADWRWMRSRDDTPWYPTMRLFRQRRPGDWAEVFERMVEPLRALSAARLAGAVDQPGSPGLTS
jgi:hypothetical protein